MTSPLGARAAAPSPDEAEAFAAAVAEGLSRRPKSLPCRWLYDARGSALFEEITRLPEYYPTRTEAEILRAEADAIAATLPQDGVLVEFGSGSSAKTEIVLERLPRLAAYVAVDVSPAALADAKARLAQRLPSLDVRTVVRPFDAPDLVPADLAHLPRGGFFPGSTIGNFEPDAATALLGRFRQALGPDARLVIGVDAPKDPAILVPAYDDAAGVTAAFNLNLLARINRELDGAIDLAGFRHEARWNAAESRIEMHLVSLRDQIVRVGARRWPLAAGETIHTENSYKLAPERFLGLARAAGWRPLTLWTDAAQAFHVHALAAARPPRGL